MTAILFDLLFSQDVGPASVRAVEGNLSGIYDDASGHIVVPDRDAVRAALPHYWRAAFDRSSGCFWFTVGARVDAVGTVTEGTGHMSLYSARRRHLVTIYARPYRFRARAEAAALAARLQAGRA